MADRTASIVLEIHDRASAPLREIIGALKEAVALATQLRGALGSTAVSFQKTGEAAGTMDKQVRQAAQGFGLLQKAASATYYFLLYQAFAKVNEGIAGFIQANQRSDAVLRQLTASTGSAVRGKQEFDRVWAYALKSPFTVEQLGEADKLMVNLRIDTQKWLPLVSQLAVATSDLGKGTEAANERLLRAVRIVSLLQGGTAQTGLLLRRLEPLGIGRSDVLAASEHVRAFTVDQHGKLLASADEMMKKLEDIITRRFGDVNKSLEGSFVVTVSNIVDSFKRMSVIVGQEVFPTIARDLQNLLSGIVGPNGQLTVQAQEAAQKLGDFGHAIYLVLKTEGQMLFGLYGDLMTMILEKVGSATQLVERVARLAAQSGMPGAQEFGQKLQQNIARDRASAVGSYMTDNAQRIQEALAGRQVGAIPSLPPEFGAYLGDVQAFQRMLLTAQGQGSGSVAQRIARAIAMRGRLQEGVVGPNGDFGSLDTSPSGLERGVAQAQETIDQLLHFQRQAQRALGLQAARGTTNGVVPTVTAASVATQNDTARILEQVAASFSRMMENAPALNALALHGSSRGNMANNPDFLEAMFGRKLPTSDESRVYDPLGIDRAAIQGGVDRARGRFEAGGSRAAYIQSLKDQLALLKKLNDADPWKSFDPEIRDVQKVLTTLNKGDLRETQKIMREIASGIAEAFVSFTESVVGGTDKAIDALRRLKHTIASLAIRAGLESLFGGIAQAPGGVGALLGLGGVLSLLPFASGMRDVPRDQLAVLHKGETVAPAGVSLGPAPSHTTIEEHTTIYALDSQSLDEYVRSGNFRRVKTRAVRHGYAV